MMIGVSGEPAEEEMDKRREPRKGRSPCTPDESSPPANRSKGVIHMGRWSWKVRVSLQGPGVFVVASLVSGKPLGP